MILFLRKNQVKIYKKRFGSLYIFWEKQSRFVYALAGNNGM